MHIDVSKHHPFCFDTLSTGEIPREFESDYNLTSVIDQKEFMKQGKSIYFWSENYKYDEGLHDVDIT